MGVVGFLRQGQVLAPVIRFAHGKGEEPGCLHALQNARDGGVPNVEKLLQVLGAGRRPQLRLAVPNPVEEHALCRCEPQGFHLLPQLLGKYIGHRPNIAGQ